MGTINVTTSAHELTIDGTKILMQFDPTASDAWTELVNIEVVYDDRTKQDAAHKQMLDALSAMCQTPSDAEALQALPLGTATLEVVAQEYMKLVLGFPTVPPSNSKRR